MAFGRLPSNVKIVDANGLPTPEFLRNWNALLTKTGGGAENGPSAPQNLRYSFEAAGIRFTCDDNPLSENIVGYQWRIGAEWDTAVVVMPLGASSVVFPINLSNVGTNTVWVAAQDATGTFSPPSSLSVTINPSDLGVNGPVVNLNAPRAAFVVLKNGGGVTPSTITLTASAFNLPTPTYAWQVDGVVQVGQVLSTFDLGSFSSGQKVVRCDVTSGGTSAFDIFTIFCVNEGDDSIIAGLTNENQSISVDASGTPTSGLPASSTMIVVQGGTILTSGVVYSLVSATNCTASINSSTGAALVTAISADTASATFRATVTAPGTVIDKVMTLNKSYPGATGSTGAGGPPGDRGSLTGFGANYGISSSSWSDAKANRVISNMLTGATGTTDLLTTTHLQLGDTVTLSNGSNFSATKYWGGTSWLVPGTVIDGNLLVSGTVTASKLNVTNLSAVSADLGTVTAGTISGSANLDIAGTAQIHGTTTATVFSGSRTAAVIVNGALANDIGGWGFSSAANGAGWRGLATGSFGAGIYGEGQGTGGQSAGAVGSAINSGNYGVIANGVSGAKGLLCVGTLELQGAMTITSSTLVTNFNAEQLNGHLGTEYALYTGTVDVGNPGTPTHALHFIIGSTAFRIPVLIP